MKNIFYLTLVFQVLFLKAQEPPPVFKLDYQKLFLNKDNLLEKYGFRTLHFRDSLQFEKEDRSKWEIEGLIAAVDGNKKHIYIRIYSESVSRMPYNGSVIRISLMNKQINKTMSIYVRINYSLDFGEEVELKNLAFKEGNYFYDMCDSKKQFEVSEKEKYQTTINLGELRKHKISERKLNRILKKCKCKND